MPFHPALLLSCLSRDVPLGQAAALGTAGGRVNYLLVCLLVIRLPHAARERQRLATVVPCWPLPVPAHQRESPKELLAVPT